jgi:TATA-binding protein-associated factor Taf7
MNLKPFVNNKELWEDFLEELKERIEACHKKLEQAADPLTLHRTQGEIQALRKLEQLRDKVNTKKETF